MRKSIFFFLSIIISVVFLSCENEKEPPLCTLYGVVTDMATGEPVKSAGVELLPIGLKSVTGSDGAFEFDNIEEGTYKLYITKIGYQDHKTNDIVVKASAESQSHSIQLEKAPPSLRIVDEDGNDIKNINFGESKDDLLRTFNIFNDGESVLNWQITKTVEWLTIRPDEGTLEPGKSQPVIVIVDRSLLTDKDNMTTIHITSNNGSKQLTVSAIGATTPTIEIIGISSVDLEYASIRVELEEEGVPKCTEFGVVVSTSPAPSLENAKFIITEKYKTERTCYFSVQNLWPRTEYYVRAFATNELGTSYSMERDFTTKSPELPKFSLWTLYHAFESGFSVIGKCYKPGTPAAIKWGYLISTYNNADVCPSFDNYERDNYFTGTINTHTYYLSDFSFIQSCLSYVIIAYAITKYDTVYDTSCYLVETYVPFEIIGDLAVSYEDEFRWDNSDGHTYLMRFDDAVNACEQLVLGKYDDWRLPTYEELRTMYKHRNEIGGFSQFQYWTSSRNSEDPAFNPEDPEADSDGYISIDFATGATCYNTYTSKKYLVRPVRTYISEANAIYHAKPHRHNTTISRH